jgi:hypothetical protein
MALCTGVASLVVSFGFVFWMIALKLPFLIGLLWIVWWAVKQNRRRMRG